MFSSCLKQASEITMKEQMNKEHTIYSILQSWKWKRGGMKQSGATCPLGAGLTDLAGGKCYEKREFSLKILGVTFLLGCRQLFGSLVNTQEAHSVSMGHLPPLKKPKRATLAVHLFTVGYAHISSCLRIACVYCFAHELSCAEIVVWMVKKHPQEHKVECKKLDPPGFVTMAGTETPVLTGAPPLGLVLCSYHKFSEKFLIVLSLSLRVSHKIQRDNKA